MCHALAGLVQASTDGVISAVAESQDTLSFKGYPSRPFYLLNMDSIPTDTSGKNWKKLGQSSYSKEPESMYGLNVSGSKTIGFSVGEDGGFVMGSALRLSLRGEIAKGLFLEGRLSDQDIPLQPEGQTATLREIDEVALKLYTSKWSLTLGDLLFEFGEINADALHTRVQGAEAEVYGAKRAGMFHWSRTLGEVYSYQFLGQYGKQRDYYMHGKEGEVYISVISGTEKIWRNGTLLSRGDDYQIEYGEGRVDFTGAFLVRGDDEFLVEFQYTRREYPSSILAISIEDSSQGWHVGARLIREDEDKYRPLKASISTNDRKNFSTLADGATEGRTEGVSVVAKDSAWTSDLYINEGNVWVWVDSLRYISIKNAGQKVVRVRFSLQTGGGYAQLSGGRYIWIGEGLGTYAPGEVVRLPREKNHSVLWLSTPDTWKLQGKHFSRLEIRNSWVKSNLYNENDASSGAYLMWHGNQILGKELDKGGYSALEWDHKATVVSPAYEPYSWQGDAYTWERKWNTPDTLGIHNYLAGEGRLTWRPLSVTSMYIEGASVVPWDTSNINFDSKRGEVGGNFTVKNILATEGWTRGIWSSLNANQNAERYLSFAKIVGLNRSLAPYTEWDRDEQLNSATSATATDQSRISHSQHLKNREKTGIKWQWEPADISGNVSAQWQTDESNFNGFYPNIKDSLRVLSIEKEVSWLGFAHWQHDFFGGWQQIWENDPLHNNHQESRFVHATWEQWVSFSGLNAQTKYDISQTEDIPRISKYQKVPAGTGDWQCIESPNESTPWECWSSELGSYEYIGWIRDTTAIATRVREVGVDGSWQWIPRDSWKNVKGLLADIDLYMTFDNASRDSSTEPVWTPALTPKKLRSIYGGRIYYEPSIKWHLWKAKGIWQNEWSYAYSAENGELFLRDDVRHVRSAWDQDLTDNFHYQLEGKIQWNDRQSALASEDSRYLSIYTNGEWSIHKKWRQITSMRYSRLEDHVVKTDWDELFPSEQTVFIWEGRGEAYLELGSQMLLGSGEEGFVLQRLGVRPGFNHRVEAGWFFNWHKNFRTTSSVLFRFDPVDGIWRKRLNASAEAVF